MPSTTKKMQGFMKADYGRAKAGKKTRSGMTKGKLKEFLPLAKGKKKCK
jgi:hypothetical protein